MIILAAQVVQTHSYQAPRLEVLADEFDLYKPTNVVKRDGWEIKYFSSNVLTFSSEIHRTEASAWELGNRSSNLQRLFSLEPQSYGDSIDERMDTKLPWEGVFNTSAGVPAVYPVTVFHRNNYIPRQMFMPVEALEELFTLKDLQNFTFVPSKVCAMYGQIAFYLQRTYRDGQPVRPDRESFQYG